VAGLRTLRSRVVDYYDQCEGDYALVWNLRRSLAMHLGHWDGGTRTLAQALARQNEVLAERAGIDATDHVLDAGCGVGGSAIFLVRRFGCRVTGITLSAKQARTACAYATERGVGERARFAVMDYTATGFPAGRFDVVWALESVCYAHDKAEFAREAFRVLEPGGRLVVADGFAARATYAPAADALMRTWLGSWAVKALETVPDFAAHLGAAGFVNVSVTDVTTHVVPSARRLYLHSLYGLPLGRLAERLGFRSRVQTANIVGSRAIRTVVEDGLMRYALFSAEKPAG
jgi:cyclopropane fatty-acyl-phospholipid synthase-like methyltransferase